MQDIILIIIVLLAIVFGFFVMRSLDRYLAEWNKSFEKEMRNSEPSCIIISDKLSDEELVKEINRFREVNDEVRIIVYNPVVCKNIKKGEFPG